MVTDTVITWGTSYMVRIYAIPSLESPDDSDDSESETHGFHLNGEEIRAYAVWTGSCTKDVLTTSQTDYD